MLTSSHWRTCPDDSCRLCKRWVETPFSSACLRQNPFWCFDEEMGIEGHKGGGVAVPIAIIGDYPAESMQKHASIGVVEV